MQLTIERHEDPDVGWTISDDVGLGEAQGQTPAETLPAWYAVVNSSVGQLTDDDDSDHAKALREFFAG